MVDADLLGCVIVVVGGEPSLRVLLGEAAAAGALVASVSRERTPSAPGLDFRADPSDFVALQRIAAHVEQRLGPIDAVVCDHAAHPAVLEVFGPDLNRRGHGQVVVVEATDDVAEVLSRLSRRP